MMRPQKNQLLPLVKPLWYEGREKNGQWEGVQEYESVVIHVFWYLFLFLLVATIPSTAKPEKARRKEERRVVKVLAPHPAPPRGLVSRLARGRAQQRNDASAARAAFAIFGNTHSTGMHSFHFNNTIYPLHNTVF